MMYTPMLGDRVEPQLADEVHAIAFCHNMTAISCELRCTAQMRLQVASLEVAKVIRGPLSEASRSDPLRVEGDDVPSPKKLKRLSFAGPVMCSFSARVNVYFRNNCKMGSGDILINNS